MPLKFEYSCGNINQSQIYRIKKTGEIGKEFVGVSAESKLPELYVASTFLSDGSKFIQLTDPCLEEDDVVHVDPDNKKITVLYRRSSNSNSLYVTDRCNSHCLMCPQPPKDEDGMSCVVLEKIIKALPDDVSELGITGGEPSLLEEELVSLLSKIFSKNDGCRVHILTNARKFSDSKFVEKFHPAWAKNLTFGVPLYSSNPEKHDYIVQARGAFHQTLRGVLNLQKAGFGIEIRTVINKQTVDGLLDLGTFIYRSLPFTFHVALMGMEELGYVKKNRELLLLNIYEKKDIILKVCNYLFQRGVNISLYNVPLCHVDQALHRFCRQSISDFKVAFNEECQLCRKKTLCSGVFHYQVRRTKVFPYLNSGE